MALTQIYAAKVNGSNYDTVPPNTKGSGAGGNGGAATRSGSVSTKLDNVGVTRYNTGVFASTVIDNNVADSAVSAGVFAHNHVKPITAKVTKEIANVASNALLTNSSNPELRRSIHKRESYRVAKTSTAFRKGQWDPFYGIFEAFGTYSRTGSTVTVTVANHGLVNDDSVKLDFTSGAATDGVFAATVVDANSFTVTHGSSGSTSGNVKMVGPAKNTESPNSDVAANPTRSAPGDLVFRTGSKLPVRNRDYAKKTG